MSTPAEYLGDGEPADEDLLGRYRRQIGARESRGTAAPIDQPVASPAPVEAGEPADDDLLRRYRERIDARDADQLSRGRAVQGVASKYNAEQYAEAVKLATEFGISAKTVADNPEPYRQESKRRATQGTLKDAPATREWLNNLDNAAVAQDDIENLALLERGMDKVSALTRTADVARSVPSGFYQSFGMAASGVGRLYGAAERTFSNAIDFGLRGVGADSVADFLVKPRQGLEYLDVERGLLKLGGETERTAAWIGAPVERQNIGTDIAGGLGQIVGQVAVALSGGEIPSLLSLLGQGADIQGDRAEAAGASQEQLDAAVGWGAAITGITEKYQLDQLLKVVPNSLKLTILERLKRGVFAGVGEAVQEITEGIGQNIAAKTIYEPDAAIIDTAALSREGIAAGGAGAIAKFVIDAIVPGKSRAEVRTDRESDAQIARIIDLGNQYQALERGAATGELSAELVTRAAAAKLSERSPEQLESLVKALKEKTGIEYAYVDAAAFRTLYQSDDAANAAANDYASSPNEFSYYEASMSGTPVAVPIEKYLAQIAPKLADAKVDGKRFSDFVAFDPDGMTGNEASLQQDSLLEEAKKAAELLETPTEDSTGGTTEDTSQAIYDDVVKQLVATGMEKRTAEFNAMQTRAVFRTVAKRAGKDPLELYRNKLAAIRGKFEADPAGGRELTQGAIETPQFKQWFGASKVVDAEGKPLRVYHGTGKDFEAFDLGMIQRPGFGYGFHFAEDASLGNFYSEQWSDGERGTGDMVVPAYLSIKRPFTGDYYSYLAQHGNDHKAAREALIAEGYDGIRYSHNRSGDAWVAFDPTQIKSATGNTGSFDPLDPRVLYQSEAEAALPFYSALTRAAENAKISKGTAEQWMGSLRNVPGVKAEELENTDLETWLNQWVDEQGNKIIPKQQVIDYLKANQLVIEEDESGAMPQQERDSLADGLSWAADEFEQSIGDSGYHDVNAEPNVKQSSFTSTGSIEDENGDTQDLNLTVKVLSLRPKDYSRSWSGARGGIVEARIKLPDGRMIDAEASFDFDDDDGSIGDLEATPVRSWESDDDFTDAEYEEIEKALLEITLEPNRELDPRMQDSIESYRRDMARAAESLREGDIDDARKQLEDAYSTEREYGDSEGTAWQVLERLKDHGTNHDTWQEDGPKENYTEFKLLLPVPSPPRATAREIAQTAAGVAYSNLAAATKRGAPPEELAALKEALKEANEAVPPIIPRYTSPPAHWPSDEKNIVAFVRFNERTDADGKRVLFLEEIQSDWHAAGREHGYVVATPVTLRSVKIETGFGWVAQYSNGRSLSIGDHDSEADARLYAESQLPRLNEQAQHAASQIPDAPFKTSWQELAFKRMLRYAADNGFERIAWTTGEMQIQRYNLAKVVDEIEVVREADGQFTYRAKKDNQATPVQEDTVKNVDALAGALGSKDMGRKAAALEPGGSVKFRGEDLKIGGAKQRLLYDVALPGTVNKLVKKWGGKVGSTTIDTGLAPQIKSVVTWTTNAGAAMNRVFDSPQEASNFSMSLWDHGVRNAKITSLAADQLSTVQSVDITPAIRDAALAGFSMFQRGTPTLDGATLGKRGSITFGGDGKLTINLFEKRDLSTYLHESGHLYLELLGDLAEDASAPQQIKDDYATLLKWFGVKDRAGIGEDQHEQFARGFEAYLAEGKAPSVELQGPFFRFRLWMEQVYKSIRKMGSTPGSIGAALNVSLTDEVRAVMDRMVATDEEIEQAENYQQYAPIFTTAEDAGFSDGEFSAYRGTIDSAHREHVDELTRRAMAQLSREQKSWWRTERAKVLEEVTAEVNASPLYNAIALLTKGTQADGSALAEGLPTFKLGRADIAARFGEGVYKLLPRGSTTAGVEGISTETAAELLGFTSGADMVRAMIAAPKKKAAIDKLTDARMRERHGDMMVDGSLVDQAIESVHTEGRAKVLAAELKALNRKRAEVKDFVRGATDAQNKARRQAREANEASLPKRDEMKAIRIAAEQAIAAKKIRTISPQLYRAAERKAARVAFEMAGKGKFEEAYLAKRQQILNFELYRAAVAARTQIDKQVTYMRGLSKKSAQEKLAAAKGQYLEQVNALLARFDFTPQPKDIDLKRDALNKWVDEQRAAGREVAIPQWVLDEARTTPYKELTAAELDGLVDAAKNIEHLAKTKDRLLRNRAAAKFEVAKAELEARTKESLKGGKAPPVSKFEEGLFKELGRGSVGFFNSLLRPETIIEWLDGGQAGPWHDFFMEPANNAEYARESLRTKILGPMRVLANKINRKRRTELQEDIRIEALGQSFNRRTLISIALNMGNASNLERLLKGGFRDPANRNRIGKFTPESLIEIKDKLNATDWQFIQEMWNTAESLWPELVAFQKRMGGLVPQKIPATPIVTRFGTFTGGYWPAVYDSLASKAGAKQADSADALGILMGGNFTGASTSKSALKERTGAGGPLKLDFSAVMGRHLDQVITDITHREFAIQAMRILDDPDLSLTLQDAIGEVGWHSLRGMVGASIQQDSGFADLATKDIDNMRRRFISNLAVAALGLKVTTAFGNMVLAPIQAAARVNPAYILRGLAKYMRHPIEGRAFVDASSEMMRNRAQNMDASFSVIREKLEGRNSLLAQSQRAAMAVHQAADHLGTTGIWLGRYHQARDAGETHEESVRLADKAIRTTQTAGAPKDLSAFERNPAYRELKLFIGPMIIMNNRMREALRGRGVIKSWPEAFGTLIAVWFLPAILWDIVNGRGPDDDDDDNEVLTDEFLPWALRKLVAYPFATLPYLRDAASLAERKFFGGYSEARMNPVSDAAWLVLKTGKESLDQVGEGDADDSDDARKLVKGALRVAGPLFGLPTGQVDITGSFIWDWMSGEYEPEGVADYRYLLMRRPKDE